MNLVIRPEAEADLAEAYAWYEVKKAGLGSQFNDSVQTALSFISEHPRAFPRVHRQVRRALIRRFPYAIFFTAKDEQVTVVAVLHARRDPRRRQDRW